MTHQPDQVVAKDAGGNFTAHPEGQFAMLCVDVAYLGTKVEQFPGQDEAREVQKVALVFASGERQEDESLTLVTTEMTLSANEKANLRKFLEAWRGKSYTADQASAGLPLTKLYGQAALLSIEHVVTRKGRTFAKISAVAPLPKPMPAPKASLLEEYQRPKFITDRKVQYAEGLAKHRGATQDQMPEPEWTGEDDADMDIPF